MNKKTLRELKNSIDHWERFSTGNSDEGEQIYSEDCPLCYVFLNYKSLFPCKKCPIYIKTKRKFCRGTPWHNIRNIYEKVNYNKNSPKFKHSASKMVNFLKSLLPKKS